MKWMGRIIIYFVVCGFSSSYNEQKPIKLNWRQLEFSSTTSWSEEYQAEFSTPIFTEKHKSLHKKMIQITGSIVPVDVLEGYYILTDKWDSHMFCCGFPDPDKVMELKFSEGKTPKCKLGEKYTVVGTLNLNEKDILSYNYILTDAELVK